MATAAVAPQLPAPAGPVQAPTRVNPERTAKASDVSTKRKNAKHIIGAQALEAKKSNPEYADTLGQPVKDVDIPFENGFDSGAEDDGDDSDVDLLDITDDEAIEGLDDGQKARMKRGADDTLGILTDTAWKDNFPPQVVTLTEDAKPLLLKAWEKDDTKGKYQAKLDAINKRIRDLSPLENVKVMENGKEVEKMLPVWRIHEIEGHTVLSRIKTIREATAKYEEARQAGEQLKMTQACQNTALNVLGLTSLLYRSGLALNEVMNKPLTSATIGFLIEAMVNFHEETKPAAQAVLRDLGYQGETADGAPPQAQPLAEPQAAPVAQPALTQPESMPNTEVAVTSLRVPVNSLPVSVPVAPKGVAVTRSSGLKTGGRRGPIFGTLRTSVGIITAVQQMGEKASRFIVNIATEGAPVYRNFPGSNFGRGVAAHYTQNKSLAIKPMQEMSDRKAKHVLDIDGFVEVERSPDTLYKREPVTRFLVRWDNSEPKFKDCPAKEWVTRSELLYVCGKVFVEEVRQGMRTEMLENYEYLKQAKAANINPETGLPLSEGEKTTHPWLFWNLGTSGRPQTAERARDGQIDEQVEPDVSHIKVNGTKLGATTQG